MLAIAITINVNSSSITWLKMRHREAALPMILDIKISMGAAEEPAAKFPTTFYFCIGYKKYQKLISEFYNI